MDTPLVERALRLLGERLAYHREVELLLVGGAAGMLTGLLPPSRTTADCDVMALVPQEAAFAVSRVNLIAMKILAGRAQDVEDIRAMEVRTDDVEFVQEHLRALAAQGIPDSHIEDARLLLNTLEVRSHE